MRRRLIVMRHAKSAWNTSAQGDHERPLNARGQVDAPRLGELIVARGYTPSRVISSDAVRTRETWDGMMAAMHDVEARFTPTLYLAGLTAVRQVIADLPDAVESVLLLGHNPGFSLAASWLCGGEIELKTAHAAVLEVQCKAWKDALRIGACTLVEVLTPESR